ncbi:hypothetical protein METHB2_1130006 [Candidatus Methylobacter favarea]|uniref:Uncharacterized protein n=1 Tax=Candidatus Methylobacter favarea TaxID=2707345 RepID=A0A8S0XHD8_9GAMM|nr:hypothetical protein METHB2_1130006 [Candidatus Methylobacter favarea]
MQSREQGYISPAKKVFPEGVLEDDIKGCIDNISDDWLLKNIPMDRQIVEG